MIFASKGPVRLVEQSSSIPENAAERLMENTEFSAYLNTIKPNSATFESSFLSATLSYDGDPEITPFGEKKIHIAFRNNDEVYDNALYNLNLRWWLPQGFTVEGGRKSMTLTHKNAHQTGSCALDVVIKAGEHIEAVNRCVLEVTAVGRSAFLYIPVVLLG